MHKDNTRYKAQNILVLKFLKESASEKDVMQAEMIFVSFIVEPNIYLFWPLFYTKIGMGGDASAQIKTTAAIKLMTLL